MSAREIVLCHPVRTAIGAFNGSLKTVPATELGAIVVRETLGRAKLDSGSVGAVVMGNVIQAGNKMNPARQAALGGGLPVSVPAMTVNRVCGSGAQAIVTAAQEIALGLYDAAIAGGMENMDRAPYLLDGGRWGYRMGSAEIHDSMLRDGLNDAFSGEHSGWHTEDLVAQAQLSREEQDRWAARSQQRFTAAQSANKFLAEIVAVPMKGRKGVEMFDRDEAPRPDTSVETLAKLRPAFREDGTITAGNAPGLNSGAAAMVVADRAFARPGSSSPPAVSLLMAWRPWSLDCSASARSRPCARRSSAPAGGSETWSASRSTKPSRRFRLPSPARSASPRTSSTSKAVQSRTATRSAPPEPC
jgi:acetyl-CoA C-acetyltransferase